MKTLIINEDCEQRLCKSQPQLHTQESLTVVDRCLLRLQFQNVLLHLVIIHPMLLLGGLVRLLQLRVLGVHRPLERLHVLPRDGVRVGGRAREYRAEGHAGCGGGNCALGHCTVVVVLGDTVQLDFVLGVDLLHDLETVAKDAVVWFNETEGLESDGCRYTYIGEAITHFECASLSASSFPFLEFRSFVFLLSLGGRIH